jgi:DNA-binding NtrC family response regulator
VLLGEKRFMAPGRPGAQGASPQAAECGAAGSPSGAEHTTTLKAALDVAARDIERRMIAESLARNDGNRSKTARDLAITRKTLARKIGRLGLSR